eukprot:TRINITY_DN3064_c0_g1_i3.p1 TRINITY_DN3064_c0_g1~~TRINITY_DN3064_c0_g1_i3.p1  ORF type:complete len:927 (-),score=260.92 TRINITY_DN3064_c0_g1_i3:30-2810(-)
MRQRATHLRKSPLHDKHVINKVLRKIFSAWKKLPKNDPDRETTYFDLLVWSALTHRYHMAVFLWQKVADPLEGALIVTQIFRWFKRSELPGIDFELQEELEDEANKFEKMATQTLDELFNFDSSGGEEDEDLAVSTILSSLSTVVWARNTTVIELAVESESMTFVSHRCVQLALNRRWARPLDEDTDNTRVAIVTLFPFLFLFTTSLWVEDPEDSTTLPQPFQYFRLMYKRGIYFYGSAVAKFWVQSWMYVAFLLIYSYVVLWGIEDGPIATLEWVVAFWVFVFVLDESNQLKQGWKQYVESFWNKVDVLMVTIFFAAFIIRIFSAWVASDRSTDLVDIVRMLMGFDAIFFYCRLLNRFSVNSNLGPLVATIGGMATDIFLFLFILMVVLLGFGISFRAALYTKSYQISGGSGDNPADWATSRAFWSAFGELFLDEIDSAPSLFPQVVKALLGIYVIVANVLLVNLLIAMMSDTYQKMSERSKEVWRFMRYGLVKEYEDRPLLPPPFSFFYHIYSFSRWVIFRKIADLPEDDDANEDHSPDMKKLEPKMAKQLLKKARVYAVKRDQDEQSQTIDARLSEAISKAAEIHVMIHEDRDMADKARQESQKQTEQLSKKLEELRSNMGLPPSAGAPSSSSSSDQISQKMISEIHSIVSTSKPSEVQQEIKELRALLAEQSRPLWPIKIGAKEVPITLAPGISVAAAKLAVESRQFVTWATKLPSSVTVRSVHITSVDLFGSRIGFFKFFADAVDSAGAAIPGIVFMRGGSVGILPILHCDGVRYTLLTVQARLPIASADFPEIPAGMLDEQGDFAGVAAKELEEETGIKLNKTDLIDLSGIATPGFSGMFPSPGGCDEFVRLYAFERVVSSAQLSQFQGKLTGDIAEGEKITLKVIKLSDLVTETPDAKALSALHLYTHLVSVGKIKPIA